MGLKGLLYAFALLIALVLVFVVAAPVITRLLSLLNGPTVHQAGYGGQMSFVGDASLVFAFLIGGVGILLYGAASVTRNESMRRRY